MSMSQTVQQLAECCEILWSP